MVASSGPGASLAQKSHPTKHWPGSLISSGHCKGQKVRFICFHCISIKEKYARSTISKSKSSSRPHSEATMKSEPHTHSHLIPTRTHPKCLCRGKPGLPCPWYHRRNVQMGHPSSLPLRLQPEEFLPLRCLK